MITFKLVVSHVCRIKVVCLQKLTQICCCGTVGFLVYSSGFRVKPCFWRWTNFQGFKIWPYFCKSFCYHFPNWIEKCISYLSIQNWNLFPSQCSSNVVPKLHKTHHTTMLNNVVQKLHKKSLTLHCTMHKRDPVSTFSIRPLPVTHVRKMESSYFRFVYISKISRYLSDLSLEGRSVLHYRSLFVK